MISIFVLCLEILHVSNATDQKFYSYANVNYWHFDSNTISILRFTVIELTYYINFFLQFNLRQHQHEFKITGYLDVRSHYISVQINRLTGFDLLNLEVQIGLTVFSGLAFELDVIFGQSSEVGCPYIKIAQILKSVDKIFR